MAISNDWDVDFVNKVISHVDGLLGYDAANTGAKPEAGDYLFGTTSEALGKIVGDIGQTISSTTSGTITLTNVEGRFTNNEGLDVLDSLNFRAVSNGGFQVGDIIGETHSTGATLTIKAIEYHYTDAQQTADSLGVVYGYRNLTSFNDGDNLSISTASSTVVAVASGAETDGDAWTGALVNEPTQLTLSPDTSNSFIINFDTGTEAVPRFALISDTSATTGGTTSTVQQVYGVTATGSLRIVDRAGSAWTTSDNIWVHKIPYDGLQSGQKFKTGDKIVTKTTGGSSVQVTGKIIAVAETTSTTGKITLQNQTGTLANNHHIDVRTTSDTWVARINAAAATAYTDQVSGVNGTEIAEQLLVQGGIYNGDSLNVIRDSNSLYTYLQDTFDELGALDDDVPMTAQVALQQFTLVNGWKIPDLSYRFLESGSIQDSALDNIWTNYQTLGTVEGIGATVYAATTPLPQFYIEQNGSVISTFWITGHIDVLVKVKTNTDTQVTITNSGALINSGTVTIFNRNYGDTYDHFETTTIAGVAPIPLATSNDLDNTTGTDRLLYQNGSGTFTVGEEFRSGVEKRGIITADSPGGAAAGTLDYILLTRNTNFANTDQITAQTSAETATVNGAPSTLVAGYGTKIVIATVDGTISYTTAGSGTDFYDGELITSSGGATGIMMNQDGAATTMTLGNITGTFGTGETLTGGASSAWRTSDSAFTVTSTISRDIGDGNGDQPYSAVIYLDRDEGDGVGDTLARMYEWVKYRTRSLETAGEPAYNLLGGPGSAAGVQGRLYITLNTSYALVKASPLGTFAGGTFFGARGVFVQDMATADIRSYQLIDNNGTVRNPPSLQTLTVSSVVSGDRVAVFRTSGGNIQTQEFQVDTSVDSTVNNSSAAIIKVTAQQRVKPLPQDVPATGVVRVLDPNDTGLYLSFPYNAVARSTGKFTLTSGDVGDVTSGTSLTAADNAFVVFIEEQATSTSVSNNIIYVSDITILTRVRVKGILPFEVSGTFGSGGVTVAAIRTFDSIVD